MSIIIYQKIIKFGYLGFEINVVEHKVVWCEREFGNFLEFFKYLLNFWFGQYHIKKSEKDILILKIYIVFKHS